MCQLPFGVMLFSSAQPSFSRWYHLLAPQAVVFVALSLHPLSVGYITILILKIGELKLKQRKGLTKFTQKISSKAGREAEPSYLSSIALPGITEKPLAESSCILGCSSQIFCLLGFAQRTKSQCSFCSPGNPHVTRMGRVSSECSSQAAFFPASVPLFGLCPKAAHTLPRSWGASWCVCFSLRQAACLRGGCDCFRKLSGSD